MKAVMTKDSDIGRGETPAPLDPATEAERLRRQRMRSIAIALSLLALVLLFYVATLVRLGGNVFNRPI